MKKTYWSIGGLFTLFLIWTLVSVIINNAIIIPSPWETFRAFINIFINPLGLTTIAMSLFRLIISMFVAGFFGLVLGVWSGTSYKARYYFRPIVTLLRTVPVISIVVILLIVFGFSLTPYLITFLMIFPLIFQAISDGIENLDTELIEVFKLENDSPMDAIRYCYLPLITPLIKTAFLQAAGLGIKVLIMAEYLAQTRQSIGNALYLAKVNLQYDQVFAWTLLLIIIAIILEFLIRRFSQSKTYTPNQEPFSCE
jgi:NitT/TauT family transport system permease protein